MMNGWSGSMSGWDWTWMFVALAAFCALAAVGVTASVHYLGWRGTPPAIEPPAALSAHDVLADRFARGEIGEDEYWQRVYTLRAADHQ